jgi:very-short-patch-repair endonuclease
MSRRIEPPDDLVAMYASAGQAEIAKRCGVDRTVVRRWLNEADIPIRPMREVRQAQMDVMPYEERLRTTAASRAGIKGKPRSDEWHIKRALGVQRAARMSKYERVVFEVVRRLLNYDPVPQFAIYKFNVDIALPEHKFAIEVDGGLWHTRHSPRKEAQDQTKYDYLTPLGWKIMRISARNSEVLNRQIPRLENVLRIYAKPFWSGDRTSNVIEGEGGGLGPES